MMQTWENGENPKFGPKFGPKFEPLKIFFASFMTIS